MCTFYLFLMCMLLSIHTPIYAVKDCTTTSDWITAGKEYMEAGDMRQAAICYHRAQQNTLDLAQSFELAYLFSALGLFQEAIAIYESLLKTVGEYADIYHNLGYCLRCAGKFPEAIAMYTRGIELDPEHKTMHFGLAMAYIFQGDYEHGWELHKRYLRSVGRNADNLRSWLATNSCAGKTVMLSPEGGLGDTLQFIRYARELKRYGITVIVGVQPALYTMMTRCPYIDHLTTVGKGIPIHTDDWTTLMSMAPILYSHEHALPEFSRYLWADPQLIEYWRSHFVHDTAFKVGICWQASVHNDVSRPPVARRGIPLQEFFILGEIPHLSLYSLQQADGLEQLQNLPSSIHINLFDDTFDKEHGAFEDSAAVIEHLDLVITIDSAIAHLAGAMGKEVWLLLPYATDWRWVHNATTSPWYPTMRIFQQRTPFDWQDVMARVFVCLLKKVGTAYPC